MGALDILGQAESVDTDTARFAGQMQVGSCPLTGGACTGCGLCTGQALADLKAALNAQGKIDPILFNKIQELVTESDIGDAASIFERLSLGEESAYEQGLQLIEKLSARSQLLSEFDNPADLPLEIKHFQVPADRSPDPVQINFTALLDSNRYLVQDNRSDMLIPQSPLPPNDGFEQKVPLREVDQALHNPFETRATDVAVDQPPGENIRIEPGTFLIERTVADIAFSAAAVREPTLPEKSPFEWKESAVEDRKDLRTGTREGSAYGESAGGQSRNEQVVRSLDPRQEIGLEKSPKVLDGRGQDAPRAEYREMERNTARREEKTEGRQDVRVPASSSEVALSTSTERGAKTAVARSRDASSVVGTDVKGVDVRSSADERSMPKQQHASVGRLSTVAPSSLANAAASVGAPGPRIEQVSIVQRLAEPRRAAPVAQEEGKKSSLRRSANPVRAPANVEGSRKTRGAVRQAAAAPIENGLRTTGGTLRRYERVGRGVPLEPSSGSNPSHRSSLSPREIVLLKRLERVQSQRVEIRDTREWQRRVLKEHGAWLSRAEVVQFLRQEAILSHRLGVVERQIVRISGAIDVLRSAALVLPQRGHTVEGYERALIRKHSNYRLSTDREFRPMEAAISPSPSERFAPVREAVLRAGIGARERAQPRVLERTQELRRNGKLQYKNGADHEVSRSIEKRPALRDVGPEARLKRQQERTPSSRDVKGNERETAGRSRTSRTSRSLGDSATALQQDRNTVDRNHVAESIERHLEELEEVVQTLMGREEDRLKNPAKRRYAARKRLSSSEALLVSERSLRKRKNSALTGGKDRQTAPVVAVGGAAARNVVGPASSGPSRSLDVVQSKTNDKPADPDEEGSSFA